MNFLINIKLQSLLIKIKIIFDLNQTEHYFD